MKTALITKIFRFEAAHNFPEHRGKCTRLHGLSYLLEVTLRGPIKDVPDQSVHCMVMDLGRLLRFVRVSIIEPLDHSLLNEATRIHTTAENLKHCVWDALVATGLPDSLLYRVRLWETDTSFAEITQEERG